MMLPLFFISIHCPPPFLLRIFFCQAAKQPAGKESKPPKRGDFSNSYTVIAKARNSKTEESVGLRVKPSKKSTAIRRLMAGDTLTVIAVGKTWSKVKDPETGKTGYVANDYIRKA